MKDIILNSDIDSIQVSSPAFLFDESFEDCNPATSRNFRADCLKERISFQMVKDPHVIPFGSGSKHKGTKSKKCKRKQTKKRGGGR